MFKDDDESDEYGSDSEAEDVVESGLDSPRPGCIDTSRVEAIPAKEPKLHAVPLKSALKKPPTPTHDSPQLK